MVEIGRDLWRKSGPTSLLKQEVTMTFGSCHYIPFLNPCWLPWTMYSLKEGDPTATLSNLFQWSVICSQVCLNVQRETPMFHFVHIASCPVIGTTEKNLSLSSFHTSFRYLYTQIKFPLSFLFSQLNSPSFS